MNILEVPYNLSFAMSTAAVDPQHLKKEVAD